MQTDPAGSTDVAVGKLYLCHIVLIITLSLTLSKHLNE